MPAPTAPAAAVPAPMAGLAALRAAAEAVAPGSDWASYEAAAHALDALGAGAVPPARRARVAIVASFTADPLVAFLRVEAARLGVWVDAYVAPYGQYLTELLSPDAGLSRFRPQLTLVLVDAEVLWNMYWGADAAPAGRAAVADDFAGLLAGAIGTFRTHGSGIVVVNDLAAPRPGTGGAQAFRDPASFARVLARAGERLRDAVAVWSNVYIFPFADLVAELGRARAVDRRRHYRGHVTWSDALFAAAGRRYAGYAAAAVGAATKCIVLDLDNTLWGGVLGEDGAGGIAVAAHGAGREFLDFQRQLLELQRQGFLLALCSKNDEADALAVLREHPEMLLRETHVAARRINWQDKATNLRELAAELRLGLEHLLFLDDSPHERAWVRARLPEVQVPELPADPAAYADWLGTLPSLVMLQRTAEDARRTEHFREERAREALRGALGDGLDAQGFLAALDLRVRVDVLDDADVQRVVQLFAKTNQFNLTTRRHDEATLRRRAEAGHWRVYAMRVADRFGDFGLTGVAVVEPGPEIWHLESFLLSCRVIGKSAESALLAVIAAEARAAGATTLSAEFVDTERNAPARDFLPAHGFEPAASGRFVYSLARGGLECPPWITLTPPPRPEARGAALVEEAR